MKALAFSLLFVLCAVSIGSSCADPLIPRAQANSGYVSSNGLATLYTPTVKLTESAVFDGRIRRLIDVVEAKSGRSGDINSARSLRLWEASRVDRYDPSVGQRLIAISTERLGLIDRYQLVYEFLRLRGVGDPKTLPDGLRRGGEDSSWFNGKVTGNYGAGAVYQALDIPTLVYEAANAGYQLVRDIDYGITRYRDGQESLDDVVRLLYKHFPIPVDDAAGRRQVSAGYSWASTVAQQDRVRRVLTLARREEQMQGNQTGALRSSEDRSRDRGYYGGRAREDWGPADRDDWGSGGDGSMNELDFTDDPFVVDLNEPSGN
jgi:hypothetical protein